MYINNWTLTKPSQEALNQCDKVVINNPAFRVWKMKEFCRNNNLSLVWSELVDTTDVSSWFDEAAAFYFIDPADATFFRLRFK